MEKIQIRKGECALGVDFGTLSGRDVIDEKLPDSAISLQLDWALQDLNDYIEVFKNSIPALLAETGIDPTDIIGSDIDVTAFIVLPTNPMGHLWV